MLDHITLRVGDIAAARAFYDGALAGLDLKVLHTDGAGFGYGADRPFFWIFGGGPVSGEGVHVAFLAKDRAGVDAFHRAALAAGGTDNGAPGPRPHYHPNYYGAFVLDPEGRNIEAVCHAAP